MGFLMPPSQKTTTPVQQSIIITKKKKRNLTDWNEWQVVFIWNWNLYFNNND